MKTSTRLDQADISGVQTSDKAVPSRMSRADGAGDATLAGAPVGNRLLTALPSSDRALLQPHLESVPLAVGQILERPGASITHAYFPESGLVSIIGANRANRRIEVGMVGHEGATGLGIMLGIDRAPNEALVQSAGAAWRLPTAALRRAIAGSRTLNDALLRFVHVFMIQGNQTAIAAGRGKIDERLARGLLMWHDRVREDSFLVTHDFLALLLGVRRPGVTVALHELEGKGLIRSTRSMVHILDRRGLERAAHGFYGIPEAEYERSIGARADSDLRQ